MRLLFVLTYQFSALASYGKIDNMNMPRRIQFANGNTIEYIYTASGKKLRTIYYTASTEQKDSTEYFFGGLLTRKNNNLDKYLFDGGYFSFENNTDTPTCHYYNRDHLGNIREVISQTGAIEQVTHYYPFGTPYSDSSVTNPALQPYKYNGKEFDAMHGLHTYDYGARQYDPLLVVWHGVDPLCEKDYRIGVNVYCRNNPVKCIDRDGRDYDVFYDGSSITISATYFTDELSAESARNAIGLWNNLNGHFTMDNLPVIFDFNVSVITSEEIPAGVSTESYIKGKANTSISGNTYMLKDITNKNKNGETQAGRLIYVAEGRATPLTGAHELGHSVGLQHSNRGLMTSASSDPNRSNKVSKNEVKSIIRNAVRGKPSTDENGNPAGRGHFHNNSNNPNVKFKYKMEDLEE